MEWLCRTGTMPLVSSPKSLVSALHISGINMIGRLGSVVYTAKNFKFEAFEHHIL